MPAGQRRFPHVRQVWAAAQHAVRWLTAQRAPAGKRGRIGEQGQSLAWTAVVLSFLLLPLITAVADGGRLLLVRNRLQTATDAACEDAAWSAADYETFRASGVTTFQKNWYWIGRAQATFNQTLGDQNVLRYAAWVDITPDHDQAYMNCRAMAQVPLLMAGGLVASPLNLHAVSSSRIRFRSNSMP
jgi:hypothetical protein